MFPHRIPQHSTVPPPKGFRPARDPRRSSVPGIPSATIFVATVVVLALATISALIVIAAAPAGIAVPTGMLLIGSLMIAASPAARNRLAPAYHVRSRVPPSPSLDESSATREQPTRYGRSNPSIREL